MYLETLKVVLQSSETTLQKKKKNTAKKLSVFLWVFEHLEENSA